MRVYILLSVLLGLAAALPGKGNSNNNNNNNAAATTTTAAPTTTTATTVVDGDVRISEYLSMTSLLTQTVAHFTRPYLMFKAINQPLKIF